MLSSNLPPLCKFVFTSPEKNTYIWSLWFSDSQAMSLPCAHFILLHVHFEEAVHGMTHSLRSPASNHPSSNNDFGLTVFSPAQISIHTSQTPLGSISSYKSDILQLFSSVYSSTERQSSGKCSALLTGAVFHSVFPFDSCCSNCRICSHPEILFSETSMHFLFV